MERIFVEELDWGQLRSEIHPEPYLGLARLILLDRCMHVRHRLRRIFLTRV